MIYFLYPQLRKLSGAERLILKLADYVTREGEPVTLLTHRLDASCRPVVGPNVRVVETGENLARFRRHYLDAPFEYTASLRLLRRLEPDSRALTFFGPPSLPALYWSRAVDRRRQPHLYFCYEPPRFAYSDTGEIAARLGPLRPVAGPALRLYRGLDRRMARRADALLGNSNFGASLLSQVYGRPATVIPHGADFLPPDAEQVQALRARLGLVGRGILLTVNFLHPRKRIDLFLRALAAVKETIPDVVGLVVGSGPEAVPLQQLASALGLGASVRFVGFVPDQELPAFYALADVYVHTCRLESFGLSVLEACAAGRPVVAVDEGGPREILVAGETGFLVPATPDAIAAPCVELLGDDNLRAAMGRAGAERAHRCYSWEQGARVFLQALRQLESPSPQATET